MKVTPITDADDVRVSDYRHLTDIALRKRVEPAGGLFMAESHQVIARAIDAGYPVRSVLTTSRWLGALEALRLSVTVPVYVADERLVNGITGYRVHRGALAAMERQPLPRVDTVLSGVRRLLILEGIVDHTNVGALFRSAAALGFEGCLIDPTCADPLYRRSVRVSMGAVFRLPWTRVSDWPRSLDALKSADFAVVALTPRTPSVDIAGYAADPPHRLALLLGSEGHGLSEPALERVSTHVRIPMAQGVDSLNVAAAAAVACYALAPDAAGG